MSKGGSGTGDTQTIQKADPWAGIQPYLSDLYGRSSQLSMVTPQYYPGQTYANYNPYQFAGMGGMLGYAGLPTDANSNFYSVPTYDYDWNISSGISGGALPTSGTGALPASLGGSSGGMSGLFSQSIADVAGKLPQNTTQTRSIGNYAINGGIVPPEGGPVPTGSSMVSSNPYPTTPTGASLPQMNTAAQSSWFGQLAPNQTSASRAGSALMPNTTDSLRNLMYSGGNINQPLNTPQVSGNVSTPQIGFNPSTPIVGNTQFNLPGSTYEKMMSGQVDLGSYNDIADAMTGRMTRSFTEDVLPQIRDEGILTGAYGGSRQDLATQGATDRLYQNMGDALSNLYGGAYQTAMNQRTAGAQLATEAGLGVGRTGAEQSIEQARLGLGTQQLAGQLGTAQAQLGMDTQRLAANIGTENANLVMQAQQLSQQGRTAEADAMLKAAGLSSDLITSGGQQDISQADSINKALALSPTMAQMGMMPYDIMNQVGGQIQGQDQLRINEAMNRYNYNMNAPWQSISNYTGALAGVPTGAFGTTTTNQSGPETNPLSNALGVGGMTAGLYSMGMMNPYWAVGLPLASYFLS